MNWNRTAVTSAMILGSAVGGYKLKVYAQQELPTPCSVIVPAEWGEYKGMSARIGLVFEDKSGTLRIIPEIPCSLDRGIVNIPRVLVEIRRK